MFVTLTQFQFAVVFEPWCFLPKLVQNSFHYSDFYTMEIKVDGYEII